MQIKSIFDPQKNYDERNEKKQDVKIGGNQWRYNKNVQMKILTWLWLNHGNSGGRRAAFASKRGNLRYHENCRSWKWRKSSESKQLLRCGGALVHCHGKPSPHNHNLNHRTSLVSAARLFQDLLLTRQLESAEIKTFTKSLSQSDSHVVS